MGVVRINEQAGLAPQKSFGSISIPFLGSTITKSPSVWAEIVEPTDVSLVEAAPVDSAPTSTLFGIASASRLATVITNTADVRLTVMMMLVMAVDVRVLRFVMSVNMVMMLVNMAMMLVMTVNICLLRVIHVITDLMFIMFVN